MPTWLAGLVLLGVIGVLWALFAGGAAVIRRITGREAPARLTGSADDYPSRGTGGRGRWPDDTGH